MFIVKRPYHLALIMAGILLLAGLVLRKQSVDLHFHDTYFVLSSALFIFIPLSIFFIILWLLYHLSQALLFSKLLTWIHLIITPLLLLVSFIIYNHLNAEADFRQFFKVQHQIQTTILLFMLAQL